MLDASSFRSVLGRFASGIVVVTVRDPEGKDHGMTVSAFTSVSLEPPLVLVCVDRGATMHDALYAAERFAINLLSDQQEALSRRFAETRDDRFDGVGYTRDVSDAALLDDALASLECTTWARYDGGDHTIIVGLVDHAAARDARPLLYYRGGYAQLER
jgi:flavin reductase (DIM6/NTAB) family NADH-FMN oxidoreductase RutF